MGKKNNNNQYKQRRQDKKMKRNTAVTFDENDRSNYLKGMIGSKKRRR